jgi:hypothetical protein
MKFFKQLTLIWAVFLFGFINTNCKNTDSEKQNLLPDTDTVVIDTKIEQAKEIFYSLPAPHEVASFLLANDDSYFDASFLSNLNKASGYTTEAAQAYNLGIFLADLSYASLFDQNQVVINYMATSKKLAEQLGILNAFDQETIDKLEQNINNRDEVMRIISESFMNSDAYLQENNRQNIGAMILIGGWVEGVYLAVELSENEDNENIPLISSILDQQLSLELINEFLKSFNDENLNIAKDDLTDLYNFYSKMKTDISADGYLVPQQDQFKELCEKIKNIRQKLSKLS